MFSREHFGDAAGKVGCITRDVDHIGESLEFRQRRSDNGFAAGKVLVDLYRIRRERQRSQLKGQQADIKAVDRVTHLAVRNFAVEGHVPQLTERGNIGFWTDCSVHLDGDVWQSGNLGDRSNVEPFRDSAHVPDSRASVRRRLTAGHRQPGETFITCVRNQIRPGGGDECCGGNGQNLGVLQQPRFGSAVGKANPFETLPVVHAVIPNLPTPGTPGFDREVDPERKHRSDPGVQHARRGTKDCQGREIEVRPIRGEHGVVRRHNRRDAEGRREHSSGDLREVDRNLSAEPSRWVYVDDSVTLSRQLDGKLLGTLQAKGPVDRSQHHDRRGSSR